MVEFLFRDRREAGSKLGRKLKKLQLSDAVILALPRGGVVVAQRVAEILKRPFDVVISRKIGAPGQPEFGIGAISEDERPIFQLRSKITFDLESYDIQQTIKDETQELRRRVKLYREGRPIPNIKDKIVVLVDDGLATGVTAVAASEFLRKLGPQRLILAVPVGPKHIDLQVQESFDQVICLHTPVNFGGVGLWYEDFAQVEDQEVLAALTRTHG